DQVNTVLDRPLTTDDIEGVYAGLRPLLSGEADSTSKLSREHAVVEPMLGLLLVAGGKYTTYRVMAADVIDRGGRRLRGGARRPAAAPAAARRRVCGGLARPAGHGTSARGDRRCGRAPARAVRHTDRAPSGH